MENGHTRYCELVRGPPADKQTVNYLIIFTVYNLKRGRGPRVGYPILLKPRGSFMDEAV